MNQTIPNELVQLGSITDINQVSHSSTNKTILQKPHSTTNMETFDLDGVLSREYELASLLWSTTQGASTVIGTYNFPRELFNQRFISEKVRDFRLIKAGIRFSVRISASSWLYGKVMIVADPCPTGAVANNRHNFTTTAPVSIASGYPHLLVSASSAETAILDLPYISEVRAAPVDSVTDAGFWRVRVVVLNPLTHVEAIAATAQILVTAQFLEPQLFLPHDVTTQSKRRELTNKTSQHSVSHLLESKQVNVANVTSKPITSSLEDIYSIAKGGMALLGMMGLSKPTTLDMTQVVKVNPYMDLSTSKGIDTSVVLGLTQDNEVSTAPVVGGVDVDEMDLTYVASTPMLVDIVPFISTTPTTMMFPLTPYAPSGALPYVDFVTQMFRWYSGSYKYKFYITASNMHSVRVVFYLNETNTQLATSWENCYHRIVEIQGDTEVEMTIPYCSPQFCDSTNNPQAAMAVYAKVLSWSQANMAVSNPIYINVYKAGSDDFRFGGLKDFIVQPQSNPRKDFSKPFQPIHESVTEYGHQGIVWGEEYTSLREVVHRYVPVRATVANPAVVPAYMVEGTYIPNEFNGMEAIGLIYRFWRGSVRYKLIQRDNVNRMVLYSYDFGKYYGGTSISSGMNPLVEVSLPYYTNVAFRSTSFDSAFTDRGILPDKRGGQYVFKAAGDDFSFLFLTPPPTNIIIRDGEGKSLVSFRDWLST